MRRFFLPALVASSSLWLALTACSAAGTSGNFNEEAGMGGSGDEGGAAGDTGDSGAAGDDGEGGAAGTTGGAAGSISTAGGAAGKAGSGGKAGTGGSAGQVNENVLLYAHTDSELYLLDTKDLTQLTDLGAFDCVGNTNAGQDKAMTDLAVNKDSKIWGVSDNNVHLLEPAADKKSVHCAQTIKIQTTGTAQFYGLSFAPIGTVSTSKEVLIAGNTAGELWAVDDQGKVSMLGNLGTVPANDGHGHTYDKKNVGQSWELAGDMVFLANNGSPLGYAIVRDCPSPPSTNNCNSVNTLVEIDMSKLGKAAPGSMLKSVRGKAVTRSGCSDGLDGNYGNVYGIAAWNDRVYGFSRLGHLVDLETKDGSGCLTRTFDGIKFSGAGVTTLAPVVPPIG